MAEKHEPPIPGLLYAEVKDWHDSASGETGVKEPITTDLERANIITSMIEDKVTHHKVVLDIDLPAKLIPSSTPGHFHLYIDHEIEKDKYFALVKAMVDAGLVEPGYLGASEKRGYTAARLPWIKKEVSETKRRPGEHEWKAGAKTCSCGHPVDQHYTAEEDPWCTVLLCKVDGCDHPEPADRPFGLTEKQEEIIKDALSKPVRSPLVTLTEKQEKIIDAMSIAQMHYLWSTAPLGTYQTGDPYTEYFMKVMAEKRLADPVGWTAASKMMGRR